MYARLTPIYGDPPGYPGGETEARQVISTHLQAVVKDLQKDTKRSTFLPDPTGRDTRTIWTYNTFYYCKCLDFVIDMMFPDIDTSEWLGFKKEQYRSDVIDVMDAFFLALSTHFRCSA